MSRFFLVNTFLAVAFNATLNGFAFADNSAPAIPSGFNRELLRVIVCPENLTPVRFASQAELLKMNSRIETKELKTWAGAIVSKPVEAVLVRKDGKIAYRVDSGIPVMLIEKALVLDSSIGKPNPSKYRTR